MTVQPPEQPLPRDRPCGHVVWDTAEGRCAICEAVIDPDRPGVILVELPAGPRYPYPQREDRA